MGSNNGIPCSLKDFSKCVTASASAKLLENVRKLPDKFIAEQTVTRALVIYFESVKNNICSSLLLQLNPVNCIVNFPSLFM